MSNFITFKKITLHNFGSYGHTELDLEKRGFCLVSGHNNYKKDNAYSNGSGKSLIWSGICFAITGETIQGLRTNLKNINVDEDLSYVELLFEVNKDEYIVKRQIAPKNDLFITKNSENISGKGIRESEKKLGEVLPDLTKDLIASTIILGQGLPNKFSSFSPSGRKDLLEKLTKSDFMIEDIRQRVTARQDILASQLREFDDSLLLNRNKLKTDTKTLEDAINERDNSVKPDFDKSIAESNAQLASINNDIEKLSADRKSLADNIETLNKALIDAATEKSTKLHSLSESYHSEFDPASAEKLAAETTIKNLQAEVNRLKAIKDVCPICGQKLQGVHKPDTSAQEAEIKKLTEDLAPIINKINEINNRANAASQTIEAEHTKKVTQLNADLAKAKKECDRVIDELNDCTQNYNTEKEKYNKLVYDKANYDSYRKNLETTIKNLESSTNSLGSLITLTDNARAELLEHIAVVRKMDTLIKRDFRGFLLENIIKYIDIKAKDYCEIVFGNRDLDIFLDGNVLEIIYGKKMFDNLSGGEKQRVDLILQFALRNMLSVYLNTTSNILVLDEITDFLDKTSCEAVMKLVETELNTVDSVFIVSHHTSELDISTDSEIQVVKDENGISNIL